VAAALLVNSGNFDVVGAHMKCWSEGSYCTSERDAEDARLVAAKLGIPFYVFDFEEEYRGKVFGYMVDRYLSGETPNPDVMCNKEIKFGIFLKKALELGAEFIATGHYVRSLRTPDGKVTLHRAIDSGKDQSYFLWTLTQDQLKSCFFPIGDYIKKDVRKIAEGLGLATSKKKDSQGLCFVGDVDFSDFLRNVLPQRKGEIITVSGKKIGEHDGVEFYTIGQRKGIGIGGGIPYYVADKNIKENKLIVAEGPYDGSLFKNETTLTDVNWILGAPPKLPLDINVMIRYRQTPHKARITKKGSNILVKFKDPQRAVTTGQSAVFYKDGEMLGGGVIVR